MKRQRPQMANHHQHSAQLISTGTILAALIIVSVYAVSSTTAAVSGVAAAVRLAGLPPHQRAEQLQDWQRWLALRSVPAASFSETPRGGAGYFDYYNYGGAFPSYGPSSQIAAFYPTFPVPGGAFGGEYPWLPQQHQLIQPNNNNKRSMALIGAIDGGGGGVASATAAADDGGQREIRSPLGTMRFGKRTNNNVQNPLGTMRFGRR